MEERYEGSGSKLDRFRKLVRHEFGRHLEKATPANVRDFLENCQEDLFQNTPRGRIELNESKTTYEEILKDFFAGVLEKPSEEALIMLWLMAFELSFYNIEQHVSDRFQNLFGDLNDPDTL